MGTCLNCKAHPISVRSKRFCSICLNTRNEYNNRLIRSGLCVVCRQPKSGNKKRLCISCYERNRVYLKTPAARATQNAWKANKYFERRMQVLSHYGSKCVCCGEKGISFLTMDHINNDGNKHRKAYGKGSFDFMKWIIEHDYPDYLQILCWNCNLAKAHSGKGICPHKLI